MQTNTQTSQQSDGSSIRRSATYIIRRMNNPPTRPDALTRASLSDLANDDAFWTLLGSPFARRDDQNSVGYSAWFRYLIVCFRSRGVKTLQDRQDLASEALLQAWRERHEMEPGEGRRTLLGYLNEILREYWKRVKVLPHTLGDDASSAPPRKRRKKPVPRIKRELIGPIAEELKKHLRKGEWALLNDYIIKGRTSEEIARKANEEADTIRKRVQRIMERLRGIPSIQKLFEETFKP
jgi:DNA-directed RNA polymerase specialized sigma24 family protein